LIYKWDQFELLKEIGEGAYAVVYLAKVKKADGTIKEVALKELKLVAWPSTPDSVNQPLPRRVDVVCNVALRGGRCRGPGGVVCSGVVCRRMQVVVAGFELTSSKQVLGNEADPDLRLEVEATADAISDCGFPLVAKALRTAAQLITHKEFYEGARQLLLSMLQDFRAAADMEDEACVMIVQVQ
jgi:hypothetical protein